MTEAKKAGAVAPVTAKDQINAMLAKCQPEGVVFGMPEQDYHADPSLGSTSIKLLMKGASDYWWGSHMNPMREDKEEKFFLFGAAFHKLVLEGRTAFDAAYAQEPSATDYPLWLDTVTNLKDWLTAFGISAPSKANKPELQDLVRANWAVQNPGKPCPIPEDLKWAASDGGAKELLKAKDYQEILLSARMVTANPSLAGWLGRGAADDVQAGRPVDGFTEVSVFWREQVEIAPGVIVTVPCKARFDYFGLRNIVDLKTIANQKGVALRLAIRTQIWAMMYDLQAEHYMRGREEAQVFAAEGRVTAWEGSALPPDYWLKAFAKIKPMTQKDEGADQMRWSWCWVFVQKHGAPIAEGKLLRRDSDLLVQSKDFREAMLDRWARSASRYGTDMWIHEEPIEELTASDMPNWARFMASEANNEDGSGEAGEAGEGGPETGE